MQRCYLGIHLKRDLGQITYGLGPADHLRGEPVPRRGCKWWISGNGGLLDFHKGAGSDFQPTY